MKTRSEIIEEAVIHFKRGEIVVFPTDTVFGVGCVISNIKSIERLYRLKDRQGPMSVLVSSFEMSTKYSEIESPTAKSITKKFWPGPLTLVVKAKPGKVPKIIQKQKTIGIRVPNYPLILEIIENLGVPILGPSANFNGLEPAKKLSELDKNFLAEADFFVEEESLGLDPSTVIDISTEELKILREGPIKNKDLLDLTDSAII
ncbi:MAG: threonylcarbamoyl-AMP synthase [Candidatus Woykebacteria bacterium RBG_13_40_7b]|uniref:L-threonylcarbamoyladenylate synthase n=1 Tax=Candidatus Woykebacteria bacterium RBG_13_40_7b TaxID=1802594 RepID=A0A1G1WA46_9BACT|nr:MAG: threonylcarbamoyl-AMP synthase [Candidatus Woykebacteria bacterium RBG_13_40_7b]